MGIRTIYFRSGAGSFKLPVDLDPSQPVFLLAIGGGGGGGRPFANSGSSGGGGGGALARGSFSGLKPADLIYYSVGAAGAGGASNGASGGTGGTTWANIVSNAAPSNNGQGVLAVGGGGGGYTTGGAGGSSTSCLGNIAVQSGGNGASGWTSRGSGGGGGGAAGNWNGSTGYNNGFNGGTGQNTTGDGGGGGGGGVNGAGASTSSRNGGNGGLSYTNTAAAGGTSSSLTGGFGAFGGGGGGGYGRDNNNSQAWGGGNGGASSINTQTGALSHGWSGGGGGGGGGTNNSGTTGGTGGSASGPGGGGGGGGTGLTNGGSGGFGGAGVVVITYTARTAMLPSTGALSFSDIQTYYGGSNPISLNEYYANGSLVSQYARNASDTQVPASGTISMANFRGSPFKLYRELRHGLVYESDFKYYALTRSGLELSTNIGAINNTAFTLSGGSGVAIRTLYWYNYEDYFSQAFTTFFEFSVSSTAAVSNSGWSHLIINDSIVFARSAATFSATATVGSWRWSSPTDPFANFNPNTVPEGAIFMIYFV